MPVSTCHRQILPVHSGKIRGTFFICIVVILSFYVILMKIRLKTTSLMSGFISSWKTTSANKTTFVIINKEFIEQTDAKTERPTWNPWHLVKSFRYFVRCFLVLVKWMISLVAEQGWLNDNAVVFKFSCHKFESCCSRNKKNDRGTSQGPAIVSGHVLISWMHTS